MAGIGFELKKIYGRKTLASNLWGTLYATMLTIGPMVLSALLMLALNTLLSRTGLTVLEGRFFISSTTYAFLSSLLVTSIFSTPVSRYIADCIYLGKESEIFPSAFGVLTFTTSISGVIMALLCLGIYFNGRVQVPLSFLVAYYFLGVLVTGAYTMMNYASALKHYKLLTFSFILGLLLSVGSYLLCVNLNIHKITAACIALGSCFLVVIFALVLQCTRSFGAPRGRYFAFLPYFRQYPTLAIGNLFYMLGLYAPTLIYWYFSELGEQVSIFHTAPSFDLAMFLSFAVNIPALVIFVVKVETAFYEKFVVYVSALNNGTLHMLQKERAVMTRALLQELFFVYEVQLMITVVLVCLISIFFPYLDASIQMLHMFVMLSLGICAVFCMYFTIVVFYYFSDYTGACISSGVFLAVSLLGAAAAVLIGDYYLLPLPTLMGGLAGWFVAFVLVRRRMDTLDSFLMC